MNSSRPARFPPGGRGASAERGSPQPPLAVGHRDLKRHGSVDRQLWEKERQRPSVGTPQRVHHLQASDRGHGAALTTRSTPIIIIIATVSWAVYWLGLFKEQPACFHYGMSFHCNGHMSSGYQYIFFQPVCTEASLMGNGCCCMMKVMLPLVVWWLL